MIGMDRKNTIILRLDLAAKVGRTEALLLSQLDYWLGHTHNFAQGRFWVYNTEAEWGRQLGVSSSSIKRAAAHLEKMGLIVRARHNRSAYDRTLSYSLCYDKLRALGIDARPQERLGQKPGADPWDRPDLGLDDGGVGA
ncbi:hypothetical protein SAMN05216582_105128 [Selenomonas ruminantium]|uniref:Helix-turn-helix domain-containing protein n=1 Tax=Selenomonas ruminantium TaxID=971 RepID=A0A1M6SX63_SELRU|nr:hypothetical protein [Selenomonas ruminantium]SHK49276.1 hypothetical protein SAMN05216582_105128 [Selenomonas ruminantium]